MVVVSLVSAAPDEEQIRGLTFSTATVEDRRVTRESWHWIDVVTPCIVMAFIIGAYLYWSAPRKLSHEL